MFEIYVPIKDYPGYSISNHGNVKSYKRYKINGRILKAHFRKDGYKMLHLRRNNGQHHKYVSRLVAEHFLNEWNNNLEVDHIDRNKSNNHISNLRLSTRRQNCENKSSRKNSTSKYKGVHWVKKRRRWRTYITINGKPKHIGRFHDEEEAGRAYDAAVRKYKSNKDFIVLNFP
jgi:hypothetical protein